MYQRKDYEKAIELISAGKIKLKELIKTGLAAPT